MPEKMRELRNEIIQKNMLIKTYADDNASNRGKIEVLTNELEKLLYSYYKCLRQL